MTGYRIPKRVGERNIGSLKRRVYHFFQTAYKIFLKNITMRAFLEIFLANNIFLQWYASRYGKIMHANCFITFLSKVKEK